MMRQDSQLKRTTQLPLLILLLKYALPILAIIFIAVNLWFLSPIDTANKDRLVKRQQYASPHAVIENSNKQQSSDHDNTVINISNDATISQQTNTTGGREIVAKMLQQAGINIDRDNNATLFDSLPTWTQIVNLYGPRPIVLDQGCHEYRQRVPPERRMLGPAGMFSTGTNLVNLLLKRNCVIPERVQKYGEHATKEDLGMRWQVPWGKHTPAHFKDKHSTEHAQSVNKDDVLPVVTIRNPWQWMKSMCKNHYTAKWPHNIQNCPHLQHSPQHEWIPVNVTYGAGTESYTSLVHLYNDWYREYVQEVTYPRIIIRMEDLIFYTRQTIETVCNCAGGIIRTDRPFQYELDSAKKDSPGHDTTVGMLQAFTKYSQPLPRHMEFSETDYQAALEGIDQTIVDMFHYRHPE